MSKNINLEAALGLAANGIPVLPVDGKKPFLPGGYKIATTDPDQINSWWGGPYAHRNVAIATGSSSGILVIDVDNKPGANGFATLNALKAIYGDFDAPVIQETGSGGRHMLFRMPDSPVKSRAGSLGPGLDVRADCGLLVVAPSIHPQTGKSYRWLNDEQPHLSKLSNAPLWLEAMVCNDNAIPPPDPFPGGPSDRTRSPHYGEKALAEECERIVLAPNGTQESVLNEACFKIGTLVGSNDIDYAEAKGKLQHAAFAMPNHDPRKPWNRTELAQKVERALSDGMRQPRAAQQQSAREKGMGAAVDPSGDMHQAKIPEQIAELNKKHAAVMMGGNFVIMTDEHAGLNRRPDWVPWATADFKGFYRNKWYTGGESPKKLGDAWLDHAQRRQYNRIVFCPEGAPPEHLNLWQGFAVTPRSGNCDLYLSHIYENIASGDEVLNKYLLDFMADAVQNPTVRPGVAIAMRGDQGTGKGVFVQNFGKLFGSHFLQVTSTHHLLGNFNSVLKDKLMMFSDEAFWAGTKEAEGRLKALITEDSHLIELKGKDSYRTPNYIRLFIASNSAWIVPAEATDRRFCVIEVGSKHRGDQAYFKAIEDQMNDGGREALLHFLLSRDLKGVNLRNYPKTKALEEQKLFSMAPVERWYFDCLSRGFISEGFIWHDPIPTGIVFDSFHKHAMMAGSKTHSDSTSIGMRLKRLVPGDLKAKRMTVPVQLTSGPSALSFPTRKQVYQFPSLADCRTHFDRSMGLSTEWEDE